MKLNPIANTLSRSSFSSLIFVKKPRFYSNSTGLAPCSAWRIGKFCTQDNVTPHHHQGIRTRHKEKSPHHQTASERCISYLNDNGQLVPLYCAGNYLQVRSNPKPRPVKQAVWAYILIAYQGSFTPSFSFDRNKSMQSFRPMLFFFCAGFLCTLSCSSDSLENNPVLTGSWRFRTQQSLHPSN